MPDCSTTAKPLTSRAQAALAHLQAGAYFSERLETDRYTRRTQFHTRLRSAAGAFIPGFGYATQQELEKARLLRPADCWRYSDHERRTVWREAPVTAEEAAASLEHERNRDYV